MPGVTFVSSISAHVCGHLKPSTIAAAYSRWMLPMISSPSTGGRMIASGVQRPADNTSAPSISAPHIHTAKLKGKARRGSSTCTNAGE
ncbi:MAG: hypothetical protein ABIP53_09290 [Candidatus Limnocylindrales bacterium]